jgi:hypothetical protein
MHKLTLANRLLEDEGFHYCPTPDEMKKLAPQKKN